MSNYTKIRRPLIYQNDGTLSSALTPAYGPYENEISATNALHQIFGNDIPVAYNVLINQNSQLLEYWWNGSQLISKGLGSIVNTYESPYQVFLQNGTLIIDDNSTGQVGTVTPHVYKNGVEQTISSITCVYNEGYFTINVQDNTITVSVGNRELSNGLVLNIPVSIQIVDSGNTVTLNDNIVINVKDFSVGEIYEMCISNVVGAIYGATDDRSFNISIYKIKDGQRTKLTSTTGFSVCVYIEGDNSETISNNYSFSSNAGIITVTDDSGTAANYKSIRVELLKDTIVVDSERILFNVKGDSGTLTKKDKADIAASVTTKLNSPVLRVRPPKVATTYEWYDQVPNNGDRDVYFQDLVQVIQTSVDNNKATKTEVYYKPVTNSSITNKSVTTPSSLEKDWIDYFSKSDKWEINTQVNINEAAYIKHLAADSISTKELVLLDKDNNIVAGASGDTPEIDNTDGAFNDAIKILANYGYTYNSDTHKFTLTDSSKKVVFWAGSKISNNAKEDNTLGEIDSAKYRVYGNGDVYATKFQSDKFVGIGNLLNRPLVITDKNIQDYFATRYEDDNSNVIKEYVMDFTKCPTNIVILLDSLDNNIRIEIGELITEIGKNEFYTMTQSQLSTVYNGCKYTVTLFTINGGGSNVYYFDNDNDKYKQYDYEHLTKISQFNLEVKGMLIDSDNDKHYLKFTNDLVCFNQDLVPLNLYTDDVLEAKDMYLEFMPSSEPKQIYVKIPKSCSTVWLSLGNLSDENGNNYNWKVYVQYSNELLTLDKSEILSDSSHNYNQYIYNNSGNDMYIIIDWSEAPDNIDHGGNVDSTNLLDMVRELIKVFPFFI